VTRWVARRAGLEPVLRKENGSSGQKPRAGRKPGYRKADSRISETPGTSRGGLIVMKVVGGEGVKALS